MKEIWKYIIKADKSMYEVPENGIIRYVDEQFGEICIWVEVDPDVIKEQRYFEVYGTGHPISNDTMIREYIGSVKLSGGSLIFHIYELN